MNEDKLKKLAEEYLTLEEHPHFRDDLEKVLQENDLDSLNDRFYTQLSFGTGGLRGVIGGGYNRINPFIIQQATQGLANYIIKSGQNRSAVIAYDSRNYSDLFAEEAARVLCANGIKVWLFSALRPTPELSFAVRTLEATAGIVITASHNPPEYNGYKVYWSDGGQIVPPHDSGIIGEVRSVGKQIKVMSRQEAEEEGLLEIIDEKIDVPYRETIRECSLRPELLRTEGKNVKVVYTPLHGTGGVILPDVLGEMGVKVVSVPEQSEPDGDFPTVEYPNPEETSAMRMAIDLGRQQKADLVMGTDPDSDRLGVAVPDEEGNYTVLSGNRLGVLLADYIFGTRAGLGLMPPKPAFVKTIVTTELQNLVAGEYGAAVYDVLTGFKYIAEKIREFEETGETFVFGGEESYGYLVTDRIRDKDAISAAFMTVEMTLYHRTQGRSLMQRLDEIFRKYGYFEEVLVSRAFKGMEGKQAMDSLMRRLRDEKPAEIGGETVRLVRDYKTGTTTGRNGAVSRDIMLPSSNVLQFVLDDDSIVTARPSGTEPKIKFYASCRAAAGTDKATAVDLVKRKLSAIEQSIDGWVQSG